MELVLTPEAIALAVLIFSLRVLNSAVGTVRLVVMARGQTFVTAVLGFIEALIFAYVTANVVTDLSNILNLAAYCGGFSLGIYAGMAVERRFVVSYVRVNIITKKNGHDMAVALRELGHGVTEVQGVGGSGEVTMVHSVILRRNVAETLRAIYIINPDAFVTLEDARAVQHGWMRPLRQQR
ncbi:MAG: DUF5698 domain-containing protein [Anaerolineae bacterium]|nr:DUF5698 domain-containing protein [Anaerolineae bacterium]